MSTESELQTPPYDEPPKPQSSHRGWVPRGYQPLPQQPDAVLPSQTGTYEPAPHTLYAQQQQSSNVMVVGQPTSTQPMQVTVQRQPPNDNLVLSVVIMAICLLHCNFPACVCLLPALCFSWAASVHNASGDYEGAKTFSKAALCCNMTVIVYYIVSIAITVISVIVLLSIFKG